MVITVKLLYNAMFGSMERTVLQVNCVIKRIEPGKLRIILYQLNTFEAPSYIDI